VVAAEQIPFNLDPRSTSFSVPSSSIGLPLNVQPALPPLPSSDLPCRPRLVIPSTLQLSYGTSPSSSSRPTRSLSPRPGEVDEPSLVLLIRVRSPPLGLKNKKDSLGATIPSSATGVVIRSKVFGPSSGNEHDRRRDGAASVESSTFFHTSLRPSSGGLGILTSKPS
jgi:hypothetical protein